MRDQSCSTALVSSPEQLRRQADAVARVRVARIQRDKVTEDAAEELERQIIAALDAGASVRNVAVAAGMTASRIYQIRKDWR